MHALEYTKHFSELSIAFKAHNLLGETRQAVLVTVMDQAVISFSFHAVLGL